jgi:hypothetical protein
MMILNEHHVRFLHELARQEGLGRMPSSSQVAEVARPGASDAAVDDLVRCLANPPYELVTGYITGSTSVWTGMSLTAAGWLFVQRSR